MPLVKANLTGRMSPFFISASPLSVSASVIGYNKGISLGGPTSVLGDDGYGIRHLVPMLKKNTTEGSSNTPCLELEQPGMWRFRWVVKPGQRKISIRTKQVKTFPNERPSMTLKKNSNVGLDTDVVEYAPEGTDWVTIGPIIFMATGTDVVFVEIRNNLNISYTSAYFDHIIVT